MEVWHPDAEQVRPRNQPPGVYLLGVPWRQVIHTTEATTYNPTSENYYGHQNWPHATTWVDKHGRGRLAQHYPIDRAARALANAPGGVETNRQRAVQVEVAWRAADIANLPDALAEITGWWLRWVAEQTGSRLEGPTFYGPNPGWVVASPTARQRMTFEEWRRFDGVAGHQHVPENAHWDPGGLDLARLVRSTEEIDDMFNERDREALSKVLHELRGNADPEIPHSTRWMVERLHENVATLVGTVADLAAQVAELRDERDRDARTDPR